MGRGEEKEIEDTKLKRRQEGGNGPKELVGGWLEFMGKGDKARGNTCLIMSVPMNGSEFGPGTGLWS